jgi:hypothetical protein
MSAIVSSKVWPGLRRLERVAHVPGVSATLLVAISSAAAISFTLLPGFDLLSKLDNIYMIYIHAIKSGGSG